MGAPAAGSASPRVGRVVNYDVDRGLGLVAEDVPGSGVYRFHCTAIAGGTRVIDEGTPVAFLVVPGLGGEYEGRHVTALGSDQPA